MRAVRRTAARITAVALAVSPLVCCGSARPASAATVVSGPFVEDFSGPAGSMPNPQYWSADTGPSAEHGWEKGSLQTYTSAPDNVRLDGYGNLVIEARKTGDGFTSGRVVTRGKIAFPLGTLVARMKLPSGQGLWPAFWMLGVNIDTVGWPGSGEVDIIELINTGTRYNIALHGPGADVESKGDIADLSADFHNYWVTRRADSITVGVDDVALAHFTPESLPEGAPWVFSAPMFVLLNVAVGGHWPGPPDESTRFPAAMIVDYVSFEPEED